MKKNILLAASLSLALFAASGCSTVAQDFSIAGKLNSLKSNPQAKPYAKVTARAEKAYYAGKNDMALKLIDIVEKKVARGSTY